MCGINLAVKSFLNIKLSVLMDNNFDTIYMIITSQRVIP